MRDSWIGGLSGDGVRQQSASKLGLHISRVDRGRVARYDVSQMRMLAIALMTTVIIVLGAAVSHSIAAAQDQPPATEGTVIMVTSVLDEVNGDVVDHRMNETGRSTVARLIANPGPDGISLREAIEATNQDPGRYTIVFAPDLAGSTIEVSLLPALAAGRVTINGDINGDGNPDISIQVAPVPENWDELTHGLTVSSSDNTLHALELIGFDLGVALSPFEAETTYANTTLSNLVIRNGVRGIQLNSPEHLRPDTQIRWINLRIERNQIDVTEEAMVFFLTDTIGEVVDGLAIENNELRGGIGLLAGFWDRSMGNQFTNVMIANNTIKGEAGLISLTTGAVGSDANLISGVQIRNNLINVGGPDVIAGAILLSAADASTAWQDPDYTPVGYPENNHIRDIEIIDNTITWTGDIGIQITAGQPGNHNSVENVRIIGNELRGDTFIPGAAAIAVHTGSGNDIGYHPDDVMESVEHRVSGVYIEDNTIQFDSNGDLSAAIALWAGWTMTSEHRLSDVRIIGNDIESDVSGIFLLGGGQNTTGNQISGVELICNRITGRPEILLIGGRSSNASGNLIEDVVLSGNLTGDVLNDVSSEPNLGGATGNEIQWTATDGVPENCSITVPSPAPSTETPATTQGAAESNANEKATDQLDLPWIWVIGAAAAVAILATVWLLLTRRGTDH